MYFNADFGEQAVGGVIFVVLAVNVEGRGMLWVEFAGCDHVCGPKGFAHGYFL